MDPFDRFVLDRKEDLKRIARHTRGEHEYRDIVNGAWIMARTLSGSHIPINLLDVASQEKLIQHLYQHFVRYTERNVRHAVRLDHAPSGYGEAGKSHPLLNELTSDDGDDPLLLLIASENESERLPADEHHSLAGAYLMLLQQFDNRMSRVANHLLISTPHAYRCCGKARWLAISQYGLSLDGPAATSHLKPWRRYRTFRIPRQMEFDFEEELPFAPRHFRDGDTI